MLASLSLENLIVLDIETVPQESHFSHLNANTQVLWEQKTKFQRKEDDLNAAEFYHKAGIWAEFGKIICISVGIFNKGTVRVKSFYGDNEKELLQEFNSLLNKQPKDVVLCAHNGKEFDFPYLCRRTLINGLKIPQQLQLFGKKPWEISHIDTMELWKFGDYKNFTSLNLLCHIFNIPTPKDDISGGDVTKVYWEEQNLSKIVTYCQKDVIATCQLLLRFRGEELIPESNIVIL